MTNFFESDEAIIDLSEVASLAKPQEARVFQPWHKPRKQFVRCHQWWKHIDFLISRFNEYRTIETIRYFGLPGSDLLDISYFSKKLSDSKYSDKKLFVHGFIDSAQGKEKADLRLSELLDRNNVDVNSKVENFNFQALAEEKSLALGRIKNIGSYHLINLDLCDGVFQKRTINSMMTLFTHQLNSMTGTPWLFFLTTRADKEGIAKDLLEDLNRIFTASLIDDASFVAAIETHRKNIHEYIRTKKSLADESIPESELSEILQVCFIFWVIKLIHEHGARLEIVSTMKYKVHEGNDYPDMFSYVMRITKNSTIAKDQLGLGEAVGFTKREFNDETKNSDKSKAVDNFCGSLNIDSHLDNNPALKKVCADEMKELLKEAGWDIDDYDRLMGLH